METESTDKSIAQLIYSAYEQESEPPRSHMGASLLGHPCDRWLWLNFRHAVIENFDGRMRLLFKRGHEEEARIVEHLRKIGIEVKNSGKDQLYFDFGSHVGGSCDGIVKGSALPKKVWAILECKTHSQKSFDELKAKGVKVAKPMHWVQCCVYGYGAKLEHALYFAVNKNTDEIYTEWLELDMNVAEKAIQRGKRVALSDHAPPKISQDPSWYQCKTCPAHSMCHGNQPTKEVNCRTCAHSTAKEDGTWRCERYDSDDIPIEFQRFGCESHALHPDFVPWEMDGGLDKWTPIYIIAGRKVANGDGDAHVYTSKEILANPDICSLNDEIVYEMRKTYNARIVK